MLDRRRDGAARAVDRLGGHEPWHRRRRARRVRRRRVELPLVTGFAVHVRQRIVIRCRLSLGLRFVLSRSRLRLVLSVVKHTEQLAGRVVNMAVRDHEGTGPTSRLRPKAATHATAAATATPGAATHSRG